MKGRHAGQPALIIGHSVKRHTLPRTFSSFPGVTIGVGKWFKIAPFKAGKWWPHYWLVWSYPEIKEYFNALSYPRFDGTVLYYGLGVDRSWEARSQILRRFEGLKMVLMESPNSHTHRTAYRQHINAGEFPDPQGDVENAICAARFMGCDPIYVMGCGRVVKKYGCQKIRVSENEIAGRYGPASVM